MKRICLAVILSGCFSSAFAMTLVPVPGANGWIDPETGKFYPRAGPHVAIDTTTGRTITVTGGEERANPARSRPQPRYAQPAPQITACQRLAQETANLEAALGNTARNDPRYQDLYYQWKATDRAYVRQCE
jgi:hypothetical protein